MPLELTTKQFSANEPKPLSKRLHSVDELGLAKYSSLAGKDKLIIIEEDDNLSKRSKQSPNRSNIGSAYSKSYLDPMVRKIFT